MNWLDKVEREVRWFAIPNLMFLLSGMMLAVFLLGYALPDEPVLSYLYLDWDLIRAGRILAALYLLSFYRRILLHFLFFSACICIA